MEENNKFERVQVSYFINPYTLWIIRHGKIDEFQTFIDKLQKFCESSGTCIAKVGKLCAVKDPTTGLWVRAEFERPIDVAIANSKRVTPSSTSYKVWLVDEGKPAEIIRPPRELSPEFCEKETKCEQAIIYNIVPSTCKLNDTHVFEKQHAEKWETNANKLVTDLLTKSKGEVFFRKRQSLGLGLIGDLRVQIDGIDVDIGQYLCLKEVAFFDKELFDKIISNILAYKACRITTPQESKSSTPKSKSPKPKITTKKSTKEKENLSEKEYAEIMSDISDIIDSTPPMRALTSRNSLNHRSQSPDRFSLSDTSPRTLGRGIRRSQINTSSDSDSIEKTVGIEPKKIKEVDLVNPVVEDESTFLKRMQGKLNKPINQPKSGQYDDAGSINDYTLPAMKSKADFLAKKLKIGKKVKGNVVSSDNESIPESKEPSPRSKMDVLVKKLQKLQAKQMNTPDDSYDSSVSMASSTSVSSVYVSCNKDDSTSGADDSLVKKTSGAEFAWPTTETKRRDIPCMLPAGKTITSDDNKKLVEIHKKHKLDVKLKKSSKSSITGTSTDSSDDIIEANIKKLHEGRNIKTGMSVLKYGQSSNSSQSAPNLLVHSLQRLTPIQNVAQAYLHPDIHTTLTYMNITEVNSMQSYAWPAINRGQNLVAISPRSMKFRSGYDEDACMLYLPILCNSLIQNNYDDLGQFDSPFALILCAHKTAARVVYKKAVELLRTTALREKIEFENARKNKKRTERRKSKSRAYLLLDNMDMSYGCNIVISTPKCFKQRTDKMGGLATDLRKLCHLVIDDADIITERNFAELNEVVQLCQKMLRKRRNEQRQIQLIMTAEKWNSEITDLCSKTPVKPVVCISSHLESAIYAKVNINLQFINEVTKIEVLYELIHKKVSLMKTVVICNKFEEIEDVVSILTAKGIDVLPLPRKLSGTQLKHIFELWDKGVPGDYQLLVLSDDILADIRVTSAMWLIHYTLPRTWTHFANRFFALHDNYQPLFTPPNEKTTVPKVQIFIDGTQLEVIPRLVHFLERMQQTGNNQTRDALMKLKKKAIIQKEQSKITKNISTPICYNLLTIGECFIPHKCKKRHIILKELDYPKLEILINSEIKLQLAEIIDAIHFSARLSDTDNKEYKILSMDLSEYYRTHDKDAQILDEVTVGELYAYKKTKTLYERCKIIESKQYPKEVMHKVLLIDTGEHRLVKESNLRELPEEFKKPEPHAVEIIIANLKPNHDDIIWDTEGRHIIENMLSNIEIHKPNVSIVGIVKLVIGKTIWLDDVRITEYFDITGNTVVKLNLSKELVRENVAMKNDKHMEALFKLCKEANIEHKYAELRVATSGFAQNENKDLHHFYEVQRAHFDVDSQFEKVFFLAAYTGVKFYLGRCIFNKQLTNLLDDIKAAVLDDFYPSEIEFVESLYCLAYIDSFDLYYRVQIKKIVGENLFLCFLIDEGYEEEFEKTSLVPALPWMLSRLPAQSIPCRLYGVEYDVTQMEHYEDNSTTLWAKCVKKDSDGVHACLLVRQEDDETFAINSSVLKEFSDAKPIQCEKLAGGDFVLDSFDDLSSDSENEQNASETPENIVTDDDTVHKLPQSLYTEDLDDEWDIQIGNLPQFMKEFTGQKWSEPTHRNPKSSDKQAKTLLKQIEAPPPTLNASMNFNPNNVLTPTVFWHQNEKQIFLNIKLSAIKEYDIYFTQNSMGFSANYEDKKYELNLVFYDDIIQDSVFHEAKGLEIIVRFEKHSKEETWPRLIKSEQRVRYIKMNLDKGLSDDEDTSKGKPFLHQLGELKDVLDDSSDSDMIDYDFGSDIENDSSDVKSDSSTEPVTRNGVRFSLK